MKTTFVACVLIALSAALFADVDPDMEMFGGYVKKPKTERGKVVFLDAQKRVPEAEYRKIFDEIDFSVKVVHEVKHIEKVSLPNPKADIASAGGNVGVVIIDAPLYPALTVAPEEGWALVNIAALANDNPNAATLASRLRKEMMRAFGLAGGCSFMARGAIVLRRDIRKPSDLDRIRTESYGVDTINCFARSLGYYGVRPWRIETYEDACQQGWAPQPTNEYQKAIWDKVHAIPDKPMTIEFDPKKDK